MTADPTVTAAARTGRLVMGRQSPALREALWGLVRAAKRGDLMAPVTVVAPSRYASLSLRQELGLAGFVNVRFIQLPVLSELLGGAALAAEGRRPLTASLESIILGRTLARAAGALAGVSAHPGTQASVRASFQELRRLDEAALEELAGQTGVTGEVVSLYRKFREESTRGWFDAEDLTARAAEVVAQGQAPALTDLGHIVFYLPRSVSPAGVELMRALAREGRGSAALGLTGDAPADASILALAQDLEPILGPAQVVGDKVSPSPLPSPLPSAPIPPVETRLHVAPSTHEELRWVIRQIVEEADRNGTPFHRMAVLYRMERPYGTLVRDELALAGIPLAGPGREALADAAVGRTLLGLLDFASTDYRRDEVMAWLTGCPVRPPSGAASEFSPSRWDVVSRQAGIVGGRQQWSDRLEAYEKATLERADNDERAEAISEARAEALRENARAAGELREFVLGLAEAVTPPPAGSSWAVLCQWASQLLDSYLWRPNSAAAGLERFEQDREQILQILEELRSADAITGAPSAEEFKKVLTDSLQRAAGHLGPTGQGVFVSPLATAAGMSFDAVWLVGMVEGGAPPASRPDPLLPETGSSEMGKASRAERFDYLSALATAPRRTLSYPVAETASRREAHPSRWLLELASALAGQQVHSSTLHKFSGSPWLSVAQSPEQALSGLPDASLADILDYQLHRLVDWRRGGQPTYRHPLAARGTLARANRLARDRKSRRLTEFDGNLGQVAADARFGRSLGSAPISPTRLEAWAACPFRYFLGNVLRLGALESPEDTTTISALDRGSLIHAILEKFIVQSSDEGRLPVPGEQWKDADLVRLMQLAEKEFSAAEARGITGKPLLWNLARQDIIDDLATFLVEDARMRSQNNIAFTRVEAEFGMGGNTPEAIDPETGLRFRGYIDRVDISADGTLALVVDYKTGRASYYDGLKADPIDHGKRLQLGVYSLAAKGLAPVAQRFKAAYWFPTARGEFRFAPPDFLDMDDEEVGQRFREGVSRIAAGIREGAFPANPGPPRDNSYENCRYCDFDSLCPSRRDELWDRKKADSPVAAYRELAEDAAQEDPGEEVEPVD